jgi:hypothetical protein
MVVIDLNVPRSVRADPIRWRYLFLSSRWQANRFHSVKARGSAMLTAGCKVGTLKSGWN